MALAERLGWQFIDADGFHPPENVRKLAQGTALTDDDRKPWLRTLAGIIERAVTANQNLVIACSALKKKYRSLLKGEHGGKVRFVFLVCSKEMLARRLESRIGHFMPASLLESQLADLELPPEAEALSVNAEQSVKELINQIISIVCN